MSSEPSGLDLGALLRQAQELSQQLSAAQAEADEEVVEGTAGGGAVRVTMSGGMEFRQVTIDPAAVDPADVGLLEDLLLAALHDVMAKARELRGQALSGVAPGLLGGLPDMADLTGPGELGDVDPAGWSGEPDEPGSGEDAGSDPRDDAGGRGGSGPSGPGRA